MTAAVRSIPDVVPAPQRTLVYDIISWVDDNLVHHETGDPFQLTREQVRFLARWYELDAEGRFRYDRGAMRRMRGTGKSPFAAVLAAIELCGPCRFGGWDGRGYPIAVPVASPWVQIAATSLEQTKAIMDIAAAIWSEAAIARYGLDIGREQIFKTVGGVRGRLHTVSANPRSLRGARPTFLLADETSEWIKATGGHDMMVRIVGNLAKGPKGTSRMLELSNAYVPGEDSVAERTHNAWQKQTESKKRVSILYDSVEAPADTSLSDPESLEAGILAARGDAFWLDVRSIMARVLDPSVSPSVSRREFLNQITAEEDSLISQQIYGQLMGVDPLKPGDLIAVGFDGSLTRDGTAHIGYRVTDKSFHLLGYWEPDPLEEDWHIDEPMIDEHFRAAMDRYDVVGVGSDVHPFESWVYGWERDFGEKMRVKASSKGAVILDFRKNQEVLVHGLEALLVEMNSGHVRFADNLVMRQHWQNAKYRQTRYGASFGKETPNSVRRVDIVAACLAAYIVGTKYLSLPPEPVKSRRVIAW